MARPAMRLLRLGGYPIVQQLVLEERLLRTTQDNWCLINQGTSPPAIVMGISGYNFCAVFFWLNLGQVGHDTRAPSYDYHCRKPEQLLDVKAVVQDGITVIRRFSGGGTVIVDNGTIFVTLICARSAVPGVQLYPRPIMDWTEHLYAPAFDSVPGFHLREHDYVLGNKKFGGNAQSIIKDRWLHHTSFLWDYQDFHMAYLRLPMRAPSYRLARPHSDFMCRLKDYMPSTETFMDAVVGAMEHRFCLQPVDFAEIGQINSTVPHVSSTRVLSSSELEKSLKPFSQEL